MDKEVIYKLHYLISIFPDNSEDLNNFINTIMEQGLSGETLGKIKKYIVNNIFSKFISIFHNKEVPDQITKCYHELCNYFSITDSVIKEDDSYKVYPFEKYSPKYIELSNRLMLDLLDKYFSNPSYGLSDLLTKLTLEYKDKTNEYKSIVKSSKLKPYYGDINFILGRINYIIECIKKVLESPNIDDKIKEVFKESLTVIDNESTMYIRKQNNKLSDKEKYVLLEEYYQKVLNIENNLSPLIGKIWESYLTDPKDYEPGKPFRFMAHGTNRCESSIEGYHKLCCTLATDKCMPIPYGNIGYIVKFDPNNIDVMCLEDAGSWLASKDEFIDRDFPSTWQLPNPENPTSVYYEYEKISKLILPEDMEKAIIENNTRFHGHPLNKCSSYSEVFFKKGETPLEALALFSKTEEGLEVINSLDTNIPKIHLDLNIYREKAGLPPLEQSQLRS